jgi:trk system potassium uptake protein
MQKNKFFLFSPVTAPIIYFGGVISIGTLFLHSGLSAAKESVTWVDAFFIATSATCVTGLGSVNIAEAFNNFGHFVIMCLIQLGGLGIMTYSGLIFYLWKKRISLADRLIISDSLLHDPSFNLRRFLSRIIIWSFVIESVGALLLFLQFPTDFSPFSAIFHSVSAFCNAGFSIFKDNLVGYQGRWGINIIFMILIFLGGIGFSVLMELFNHIKYLTLSIIKGTKCRHRMSWYSLIILKTSLFLILGGAAAIYLAEFVGFHRPISAGNSLLISLFQSVTCRTAGFNTFPTEQLTNVSLLIMIMLMFIGGGSGSCAGGIKISTLRGFSALIHSQGKGRRQIVIGKYAVDNSTQNKALVLLIFSVLLILVSAILLNITEGGDVPNPEAIGVSMKLLFEVVSAFGTVGLSMGITSKLTVLGKLIIIALMFIGRLGPILFILVIQRFQTPELFTRPEESMLIG